MDVQGRADIFGERIPHQATCSTIPFEHWMTFEPGSSGVTEVPAEGSHVTSWRRKNRGRNVSTRKLDQMDNGAMATAGTSFAMELQYIHWFPQQQLHHVYSDVSGKGPMR